MGRKLGRILLGIIGGLLLAAGGWLLLTQFETIDPTSKVGLVFPVVGILLGIVIAVAGPFRKRRGVPPPPP